MAQTRVCIVDDSVVFRKILSDCINAIPNVRVAGVATNGAEAIDKIPQIDPDVITLDIEMPILNGIETLKHLRKSNPRAKIIMLSIHTQKGADATIQALQLGAFDFVPKPTDKDYSTSIDYLTSRLSALITGRSASARPATSVHATGSPQAGPIADFPANVFSPLKRCIARPQIVAVGVSTGGPRALRILLSSLPSSCPVPIVIVQHMPKLFTKSLADTLNRHSPLPVVETCQGMPIRTGHVYLAPGGNQMKCIRNPSDNQVYARLTDDPPEQFCKPSINYLFRSVAHVYKSHALGVILTGMGNDGVLGLKLMKHYGCFVIGQDEESSTVYGMPREAKSAGVVDRELPLDEIGKEIMKQISLSP